MVIYFFITFMASASNSSYAFLIQFLLLIWLLLLIRLLLLIWLLLLIRLLLLIWLLLFIRLLLLIRLLFFARIYLSHTLGQLQKMVIDFVTVTCLY